ncbi:MAG: hypothetical protein P4L41_12345 [Flavipsychrobacter sp.]|nr:hypothetical protein [Flavipsychrobacter sp.]
MNSNGNLDAVLRFLNQSHELSTTETKIFDENGAKGISAPNPLARWRTKFEILLGVFETEDDPIIITDLELILNYLLKLELIEASQADNKILYSILYEGKILIENDGFVGKAKRQTISTNLQSVQTWAIAVGSIVAAIATCGLVYFEYLKHSCR